MSPASVKTFDLITMGRSSIDLYSNDSGAPFVDIESFGAFVGGCPTNIAVGARRLGLKVGLLTAVGTDLVGDFVLKFLDREGVSTDFISRKKAHRTSAVLLGIEPPDKFPLVFYRDNCADIHINIDDVNKTPLDKAKVFLFTGTGLSREPSLSATLTAIERARAAGTTVIMDLDFRADQWSDVRAYGMLCRLVLPRVDIVIGTEEELKAALLGNFSVKVEHSQISSPTVTGSVKDAIKSALALGPKAIVEKRGEKGGAVHLNNGEIIEASPFKVEVVNVLGAGDAFAAGFIYGHLKGLGWKEATRYGNACGAIVVTRQSCANSMPTEDEVQELISKR